jgi:hypothetical protein
MTEKRKQVSLVPTPPTPKTPTGVCETCENAAVKRCDELLAENTRLKNLAAAAGEYFIKRQKGSGDDKNFEEAYLDTALPVMVALEKEHVAELRLLEKLVPDAGQLGQ